MQFGRTWNALTHALVEVPEDQVTDADIKLLESVYSHGRSFARGKGLGPWLYKPAADPALDSDSSDEESDEVRCQIMHAFSVSVMRRRASRVFFFVCAGTCSSCC